MPSFVLEHPAESYPLGPGLSIHEAIGVVTDSKSDKIQARRRGTRTATRTSVDSQNTSSRMKGSQCR